MVARGAQTTAIPLLMAAVRISGCTVPAMNETSLYPGTNSRIVWVFVGDQYICHCCGRPDSPFRLSKICHRAQGWRRLSFLTARCRHAQQYGRVDHCWMNLGGVFGRGYSHPFKGRRWGGAEATTAVVTGNADFVFNPLPAVLGQLKAGKCARLLVTTSRSGFPVVPDSRGK